MSTLETKFRRLSRTYVFPWKWSLYPSEVIMCNRKYDLQCSIPILN